jgi:uncharacterized protein YdeI (BOF family)
MVVLSLLLSLGRPALAAPLSIGQARQMPDGIEVTVTGRVTVTSGQFESASFDRGFALQDSAGGIYVSTNQVTDLQVGETVTVTGTLQDDGHGQRIIQMTTEERRDRATQVVTAKPVSIAAAKHLDGSLVSVHGTLVRALVDDAPYGDRLWIADDTGTVQIYIPRSTKIAPAELSFLKPGQTLQVTGLSSEYDGSDEVIPRDRQDLVPGAAASGNTDQYRA